MANIVFLTSHQRLAIARVRLSQFDGPTEPRFRIRHWNASAGVLDFSCTRCLEKGFVLINIPLSQSSCPGASGVRAARGLRGTRGGRLNNRNRPVRRARPPYIFNLKAVFYVYSAVNRNRKGRNSPPPDLNLTRALIRARARARRPQPAAAFVRYRAADLARRPRPRCDFPFCILCGSSFERDSRCANSTGGFRFPVTDPRTESGVAGLTWNLRNE
ncbi:hypothetical protein EVAR_274_1 [Eumeta japonica]|uniref:Uncharacterized protein n=1 Tax=Eumeta variegata TaxID=151549 RepID=A0A4C1SC92_EUMVA|nr:hypothetical protein EVAR_274_1 [Eumeta japonica]